MVVVVSQEVIRQQVVLDKPGGLDSRDQLRSSFLDLLRQTCGYSLSRFLKSRLFQLRLDHVEIFVEIVKTN